MHESKYSVSECFNLSWLMTKGDTGKKLTHQNTQGLNILYCWLSIKTTYEKTQYKPKILHTSDPSLSSNGPNAISTGTTIPPDKPLSHAPACILMAISLPPSMKSKSIVIPILMSAHDKIFRPWKFLDNLHTYEFNSTQNVQSRNWYILHTYVRTQYKPKILHT